jgi:hypothetical protein
VPMYVTLGELVRGAQQLANRVATQSGTIADSQIDPAEWKARINSMFGRLHSAVVPTGARVFELEIDLDLGNLAVPADHYMTVGIDIVRTGGRRCELPELMIAERNDLDTRSTSSEACAWALVGNSIRLYPPTTRGTYKHIYVPQPFDLASAIDDTLVDVLTSDGRDLIEWGTAAIALHRDDSNQTRAISERDDSERRLKEWAIMRSLTQPKRQRIQEWPQSLYGRGHRRGGTWW